MLATSVSLLWPDFKTLNRLKKRVNDFGRHTACTSAQNVVRGQRDLAERPLSPIITLSSALPLLLNSGTMMHARRKRTHSLRVRCLQAQGHKNLTNTWRLVRLEISACLKCCHIAKTMLIFHLQLPKWTRTLYVVFIDLTMHAVTRPNPTSHLCRHVGGHRSGLWLNNKVGNCEPSRGWQVDTPDQLSEEPR